MPELADRRDTAAPGRPGSVRSPVRRAPGPWRRLSRAARRLWRRLRPDSQIGAHLAGTVLLTGALTFAIVGLVALQRLNQDAAERARAVSLLSREQVARKLDGEARLADARLDGLFDEAARQTRFLAQRLDIVKAVGSANSVALRELLAPAAVTGDLDALVVTDPQGIVTGSSSGPDLLALTEAVDAAEIDLAIRDVLTENSRVRRRAVSRMFQLTDPLRIALGLPDERRIGQITVEPVFDDFGDAAGALVGLRMLGPSEGTFIRFSALTKVGVAVLAGGRSVSEAGEPVAGLVPRTDLDEDGLIVSADGARVARCVSHDGSLAVCAHSDGAEVGAAAQEIMRLGVMQTRSLFAWFLLLAACSLGLLVLVVLGAVRRVTSGLPQLSTAASAVARGELDVPFRASGLGEVRSLGRAFETMLANLRESLGRVRQLAFFDPVTGLANREKMRIDGTAALAGRRQDVAFLFLDLDRFKSVNDTFGHRAGDALLCQLALRLAGFLEERRQTGALGHFWLGRIGGDEFLIVASGRLTCEGLRRCGEDLIAAVSETYTIGSAHMAVGASIGVAFAEEGCSYDDLLVRADIAMYEAKRHGRGTCTFFTAEAAQRVQERLGIESDLRCALKAREFGVHYQPKVSLRDGRVVGAEALVRWHHPERGPVPPGKFIPVAEEAGLIPDIGLFVLERALEEIGALVARGHDLAVAVNVSVLQLEDPTFARTVEDRLAAAGIPPRCLELEITETVAMRESEIIQGHIARLRMLGVRFSIDDFGTGYSNLAMLARSPIDALKLDRSLVDGVAGSNEQQTIVRTILSLAASLGFETVVEGVETDADLRFLIAEGATTAQGYLFSPPVPIDTFRTFLEPGRLQELWARSGGAARRPRSA
ncbi:putative bifunctional diguanylate cyclase/phosphodiesterase [Methylobacterium nodulans]|uniref:Diguanylate cyclase/phosphodiesterase with extracellular sensor n=1 Tax=Methylobacterium nodulans (strain LMG 21967 / CNCM I-2342 / ORS 2060) TaxID=460265 RepID=B8IP52_METNO|nr:EAL domain-containing protein [Methylobacterium nodulans]ACL60370.1 diguanylate cyclase/phosphodiesterase with extracellular sensor [Methylobacterium nodulans ORS 2060]